VIVFSDSNTFIVYISPGFRSRQLPPKLLNQFTWSKCSFKASLPCIISSCFRIKLFSRKQTLYGIKFGQLKICLFDVFERIGHFEVYHTHSGSTVLKEP